MIELPPILAQTPDHSIAILKWLGVIVVIVVIMIALALIARRLIIGSGDGDSDQAIGFTLADLRRMHQDGQLTDEEFAAARARMIAQNRAALRHDDAVTDISTTDPPAFEADSDSPEPEEPDNSEGGATPGPTR